MAGRYRVVSTTSRDEHGTLYLAFDLRLQRWRTLQVPKGEAALRRMTLDAELLGRLEHPGVERVIDVGEDGPITFAVRDRLVGSAASHLPMAPPLAAQLVLRVGEGLAHAHHRGVVHGHVRPSLVRFGDDGGPVLTGFGTKPQIDHSTSGRASEPWAHLAPELRQRWLPDARSDIYALGALLYTLLAGRHQADLFYAESYDGLLAPVPGPLRSIVIAACAYEPEARPESVEALCATLAGRAPALGSPGTPPWVPEPLPPRPPDAIVPDAGVAELITILGRRRAGEAVVISSESSTLEKTPLPYVMPEAPARKDPGFRDPFEQVDPDDLPAYVDRRFKAVARPTPGRNPTATSASGRTPRAAPVREAPARSRLLPALAAVVLLALLVAGIAGVAWLATAPARADAAFVHAVSAEAGAAGVLAASSPHRAALEEAWFRFEDRPTPAHAAAYVRLAAEAGQGETLPLEAKLAVERMEAALADWERAR